MKIHFSKYQATGNDFVLIDNLKGEHDFSVEQIKAICDRKFGVGADGLMLIEKHSHAHFNLRYYNSDGSQSLCGNGSRAAVTMAARLGLINGSATFEAFDGMHDAQILENGIVRLKMADVSEVKKLGPDIFINTGSPHFIRFVPKLSDYPVYAEGKQIRHQKEFRPGGTNVNFVETGEANTIFVRTYERGVENETLSCGTGVTAAALAASGKGYKSPVTVKTPGGELRVEFTKSVSADAGHSGIFEDIYLIGPAKLVFEGVLEL